MSADTALELGRLWVQTKRIADVLTTSTQKDVFTSLPGLELYCPCGIRDRADKLIDHSGGGSHLSEIGTCATGYDGDAFVHLGDGANYFFATGVGAITGVETSIEVGIRGLTVGGWFYPTSVPVLRAGMVGRDGLAPNRGYSIVEDLMEQPVFGISAEGASFSSVAGAAMVVGNWHFVVGRFVPAAEISVFVDGAESVTATAISSIFVPTANFEVGRYLADNSRVFSGNCRDLFLCAAALTDDVIEDIRRASQP